MKMFCLFSNLHAVLNHLAALDPSNHDACFLVLNCLWLSLLERTLGALTFRLNYPVAYDHFNSERILQVKRKKMRENLEQNDGGFSADVGLGNINIVFYSRSCQGLLQLLNALLLPLNPARILCISFRSV